MSHVLVSDRISILKDRAAMLKKARAFFAERDVMEVDVPILSRYGSVDVHIDLVTATCMRKQGFLHFSPEFGMKRLLAEGIGDIYQLSHVFRDEERGERHLPEFTMAEWYRNGFLFFDMIQETVDFICCILDTLLPVEYLTYQEALRRFVKDIPASSEKRHELFGLEVEPNLGNDKITVIHAFPVSEAMLAKTYTAHGEEVASRFEIFYQGMELANGYHELTNPQEQQARFEEANLKRMEIKKQPYPVDIPFIEALKKGLPDCCGVAVGFDRLMMLRHPGSQIADVVSFALEN